mgnify:FL=1|tara:strand:+ start:515 stop:949 length:435 start_codon:yes stop_codon:yes gene_type:complete
MTTITKVYGSEEEDSGLNKSQIEQALRAGNRLNAHLATNMSKLNNNFAEHKRAIGASHQQVEDVIVDQTTKIMHHMTGEFQRQLNESNEALKEYLDKMAIAPELMNKLMEVLEKNSNRMTYGETIEWTETEQPLDEETYEEERF